MRELTDIEKAIRLQQQLDFLDYIFPQISKRLTDLESNHQGMVDRLREMAMYEETINQYKEKIQRIEQLLIENGLIHLLGKSNGQTRESQLLDNDVEIKYSLPSKNRGY